MNLDLEQIRKLAELGASSVEAKPDGTLVVRFEKPAPAPVQFVPVPYAQPAVNPWPWTIFWGTADNQLPNAPAFTVTTINMPTTVSATAEDGRRVAAAMSEARKQRQE